MDDVMDAIDASAHLVRPVPDRRRSATARGSSAASPSTRHRADPGRARAHGAARERDAVGGRGQPPRERGRPPAPGGDQPASSTRRRTRSPS
ncbi:MAG: hypothetical protein MZV64_42230 [Ignavibacteriales bacterium]|nr:hypothetical protein [Ignavibacteriales bacterium]